MSLVWNVETLHKELARARILSRKWIELRKIFREVSPYYALSGGEITIVLNPVIVRYDYIPRSSCPRWMKDYIYGRSYSPTKETETIQDERINEMNAYSTAEIAILRKRGHNGYIQGELPF